MSRKNDDLVSNRPVGSDTMEAVLSGSFCNLPDKESSVVRIFLSSTFTDMQAERNWLMKNAFPQLRQFCQQRGLDFQIADMRWGVREDATDDHKTTELCLHEIKNCQKLSRGPNFVAFLGDKYGFRPIPSEIEVSEFKLLKNTAIKLGHDISLLLTWYLCDFNREPTMYTLQPISSQYPQYFDMTPANAGSRQQAQREWWGVVEKLTTLLRESADYLCKEGKMSEEDKHKYYQSVTENEVNAGILSADDITDKVLCFERTLIDINLQDTLAGRFTDMIEGARDTETDKLRENLRMMKIPTKMTSAGLFKYNLQWDKIGVNIFKNQEHISYIKQFGSDFIRSIQKMITAASCDETSSGYRSPLFDEVLHHLHFCQTKCKSFCGRENMLAEIQMKLKTLHKVDNGKNENETEEIANKADAEEVIRENQKAASEKRKQMQARLKKLGLTLTIGDEFNDLESDPNFNLQDRLTRLPEIMEYTKPLIVYGKSGCGKTALMAKAAEMSKIWFPNSVLMIRFLGTSTMSTTIREVLVSLCLQVSEVYKIQKETGIDIETDYLFLVQYFATLLWKIDTREKNLVIILDSVDQLSQADHAHMFNWLPHKLPPGVYMMISVVSDRLDCLNNVRLLFSDVGQYVEIDQLETEAATEIINALCKNMQRHISKKQKNLILDHFSKNSQPLYLKLLVDMSFSWKSYSQVDESALGITVKEAINHLFDNLEKNHGEEIVKKSIGYLCAAKEGLTEAEMEDLLSLDDEVLQDTYIYHLPPDPEVIRLPPLLWKRVEYDISEYVVERQSGGKKVVTWYHRQFYEATSERYLTEGVRKQFHQVIAEYFQGIWSDSCKPLQLTKGKKGSYPAAMRQVPAQPIKFGPNMYNTRKLSELPYQLIHSDQLQRALADLFSNPDWLFAKCCTMTLTSLMEDLRLAERKCVENIDRKRAELLAVQKEGKKVEPINAARLKIDEEVFQAIKFVTRMVLLAADNTRKDPVNLPLMLLSQLGPNYRGSVYIEKLVQRCEKWCEDSDIPLLVPARECMARPEGNLLYTLNVDVAIEKRDKQSSRTYLCEDTMQLYVVRQQSARHDQICILDLHDHGSCITKEDVGVYVRSIKFVGDNRYMLLDVYTKNDQYDPESEERLYESSTSSPVTFDPKPNHIAVSSTGRIIACSTGNVVMLYKKDKHSRPQSFFKAKVHEHDVTALIISPDETLLVTTDMEKTIFEKKFVTISVVKKQKYTRTTCVYDLKAKKKIHDIATTIDVNRWSLVSRKNLLVTRMSGHKNKGTIIVCDLADGKVIQEVVVNETYKLEKLQFHSSEEFVFIYYQDRISNGINSQYAELVNISSGKRFGKCPEEFKGPYSGGQVFGSDSLYYTICHWNSSEVSVLFAGQVSNPLDEAVVIHVLTGHNRPVTEFVVPTSLDMLLTVSLDNTIKVWDLKTILGHFHSELSAIELQMAKNNSPIYGQSHVGDDQQTFNLSDIVTHFKPADTGARLETTRLAFNRFCDSVYVGTDNGKLQLYDVDTAELKITSDLDVGCVQLIQLSKNGRYMLVAGSKKKIHIEDLLSQNQSVLEARGGISCMAESNNILVAGSAGMAAKGRVWNIETGEVMNDFNLMYSFYCVAINSKGTQ
ncbi:NACHT domain- and WD repeat-containing protein 1-like isoform X2 [Mercenaria mercenaria]|nr:NACHT domain- and WD repeat-containing protein 1-like isoform X2 [Mercenaria mercenaria]